MPASNTTSAVASVCPAAIVTVADAVRVLLMKSPALARSVITPSGTPVSSKLPPAAVRVEPK